MNGRIGNYTYEELMVQVRELGMRAMSASQDEANALLPRAHQLISTIRDELQRDHEELARHRATAHAASQHVEARYAQSDQHREAAQAYQMNQLLQQLEQAKRERSALGLWTRLTTSDDTAKALKKQIEALEVQHDQQDGQDARAKAEHVATAFAGVRPYEEEAAKTQHVLDEAQRLVTHLMNRASGWGEGSDLFRRMDGVVQYALRANANDMDAKGYMAVTAALFGRSIDELNAIHTHMRQINLRMHHRHRLTDVEALAVLACASVAAGMSPDEVAGVWCDAVDHANRVGGFSTDEDARAMVVFCACVTRRNVGEVQSERRGINVDNFRGQDAEGAGMVLLTHTICRRPVHELVQAYYAAASAGLPVEERSYMAMAAGVGNKPASWVIDRFRGLQGIVRQRVPLPHSWDAEREAIREAAATLTIAAAISSWRDDQLVELFNRTAAFRPAFGSADYEARGSLVIGAVAPGCRL